ncbi:hypothetical protein C8Q74DRAFT_1305425 [Fomes fomentarius]|nr:hypothetical protein C8Q74DRAFT_1305425 [Fomes fomentarius]
MHLFSRFPHNLLSSSHNPFTHFHYQNTALAMEDPAKEIASVTVLVTAAVNPEIQTQTVLRYYAPDLKFRHPICAAMLAILRWYRIMSPTLSVRVNGVTYDKEKNSMFLDVTQTFHIRWSPFNPAPARLVVRLTLRPQASSTDPSKTVYVIAEQEDFYHPEDLVALIIPPLIPLVRFLLQVATFACWFWVSVFSRVFGYWTVRSGEGGKGVDIRPEGEPLPPVSQNEEIELQERTTTKGKNKKTD